MDSPKADMCCISFETRKHFRTRYDVSSIIYV